MEEKKSSRLIPILAGLGGAGLGSLFAARSAGQAIQLADSAIRLVALSTAAPILAGGLLATGVIIAAVAIPLVVLTVLKKEEKHDKD